MENKSYYAVIPATVRYDERLKLLSRMLYGEITALCNERGYCWASNAYFAELYGMSIKSISRSISELKECGYINVELQFKETKEVDKRIIRISNPMDKIVATYGQNCPGGMDKNVQDNITLNNTINIREAKKSKEIVPPDYEEAKKYYQEKGYTFGFDNWFYHYESKAWMMGKSKIKSWKATMRTWDLNDKKKNNSYQSNPVKQDWGANIQYKSPGELDKEALERQKFWDDYYERERKEKGITGC